MFVLNIDERAVVKLRLTDVLVLNIKIFIPLNRHWTILTTSEVQLRIQLGTLHCSWLHPWLLFLVYTVTIFYPFGVSGSGLRDSLPVCIQNTWSTTDEGTQCTTANTYAQPHLFEFNLCVFPMHMYCIIMQICVDPCRCTVDSGTAICCKIFAINNICNFHEWSTVANISIANIYVHNSMDVIIIICTMTT